MAHIFTAVLCLQFVLHLMLFVLLKVCALTSVLSKVCGVCVWCVCVCGVCVCVGVWVWCVCVCEGER